MAKTSEKCVPTKLISTIKQLAKTDKILTEQIKTLTSKNARLTLNGRHNKKEGVQSTTVNYYKSNLNPTGCFWIHVYKVVRGHTSITCTKINDRNMETSTRSDTMVGSTNNSEWVAGT